MTGCPNGREHLTAQQMTDLVNLLLKTEALRLICS